MSKSRFLLKCLLKLCIAAACMVAAIAAYRFLLHPLIESVFSLGEHASSIVRRTNIFIVAVLSYWGFVHFYERRPAQELSLRWRWIALAAVAGSLSIGVTILVLYATGNYQLISFRGFGQAPGILATIWVAAVLEELAFRGILFRILEEGIGTRAAWIGSSVIFPGSKCIVPYPCRSSVHSLALYAQPIVLGRFDQAADVAGIEPEVPNGLLRVKPAL